MIRFERWRRERVFGPGIEESDGEHHLVVQVRTDLVRGQDRTRAARVALGNGRRKCIRRAREEDRREDSSPAAIRRAKRTVAVPSDG